jgi:hypothetical protein
VGFARFAHKPKKTTIIFLFIAALPFGFGSFKGLAWYSRVTPKTMGGPRHPRVVVLYGGRTEPAASEGFGLDHFANRLGDLERVEC